jgi:hypothetical protein
MGDDFVFSLDNDLVVRDRHNVFLVRDSVLEIRWEQQQLGRS